MNWYTKRASLAAVYSATELYMTQDLSSDYIETEKFLQRRFGDAAWIGSTANQVREKKTKNKNRKFNKIHS